MYVCLSFICTFSVCHFHFILFYFNVCICRFVDFESLYHDALQKLDEHEQRLRKDQVAEGVDQGMLERKEQEIEALNDELNALRRRLRCLEVTPLCLADDEKGGVGVVTKQQQQQQMLQRSSQSQEKSSSSSSSDDDGQRHKMIVANVAENKDDGGGGGGGGVSLASQASLQELADRHAQDMAALRTKLEQKISAYKQSAG